MSPPPNHGDEQQDREELSAEQIFARKRIARYRTGTDRQQRDDDRSCHTDTECTVERGLSENGGVRFKCGPVREQ